MRTIEQAVSDCYAGYQAHAEKRGRNPAFPYVPVYRHPSERFGTATTQIKGRAFAERNDALACAAQYIEALKQNMRDQLVRPNGRALRAQWEVEIQGDQA